ncbi:HSP20 family protein [Halogranum gelatinilyticum]|uniref:HSP20 family protein n=1 Tax=Halogranum gelatinilyticum TaxID=660521 RepID=A0A1G9Q1F5_9EURY|nr:Hsp20/alpha crystallin family protein [Halogranum gelatinilyticum]SDM04816.1 HSP20 family protein [Halogranum gelatinilyticum]
MPDRSNPFKDIEELFDRMSHGFEPRGLALHEVAVDVSETDDELVVTADLPGYDKEDIDVAVEGDRLTITADHEETTEEGDDVGEVDEGDEGDEADDDVHYHRRERTRRTVSRSLHLPTAVDETAASATYRNGVLTVTLPKPAAGDEGYDIDVQ